MAGAIRPRRSETRPITGVTIASRPAATRKHAAIATAPAPSASSRSGASTLSVPNIRPGNDISQMPISTSRSPTASSSVASRGGVVGGRAGVRSAHTISATPAAPTEQNTISGCVRSAAAPSTGPNSAPTIAAPIAEPISSPRRSAGASPISQPSAPAHVSAPPMPWMKRAVSSTAIVSPNANATLAADMIASPITVVGRTPARAAR